MYRWAPGRESSFSSLRLAYLAWVGWLDGEGRVGIGSNGAEGAGHRGGLESHPEAHLLSSGALALAAAFVQRGGLSDGLPSPLAMGCGVDRERPSIRLQSPGRKDSGRVEAVNGRVRHERVVPGPAEASVTQ